jgi:hypothetical protein
MVNGEMLLMIFSWFYRISPIGCFLLMGGNMRKMGSLVFHRDISFFILLFPLALPLLLLYYWIGFISIIVLVLVLLALEYSRLVTNELFRNMVRQLTRNDHNYLIS